MTTIDKALDALFLLSAHPNAMRLVDVARDLDMPRSSAHRVLAPLTRRGLVERTRDGRYTVGLGLLTLGLGASRREPLAVAAKPVLEAAAADLGETFFLVILRAGKLVVLEKAEGNGFLRAAPQLGSSVPVHATAVGKLFLAHRVDDIEIEDFQRYTAATLRSRKALLTAAAEAGRAGYAVNDEEWQPGLTVVAAPVMVNDDMHGAVALATISARYEDIGRANAVRRVRHAAEGIALRMEGR